MSELHKYLAAYDEDDQDRTLSDFTTVRLAQGRITLLESTLKARTDALGRVAETNQQLRETLAKVEALAEDFHGYGQMVSARSTDYVQGWCGAYDTAAGKVRAVLEGGR